MPKIVGMSDTHNQHKKLIVPECDILIHAGDATNRGEHNELAPFLNWMYEQKAKYKIYVPGNHDFYAETHPVRTRQMCEDRGITYLVDELVELDGTKIWGSPYTPKFGDWAFQYYTGEQALTHWGLIRQGIDVLVTHGPPYQMLDPGLLDEAIGCYFLFYKVIEIKPKIHLFGHSHEGHGQKSFEGVHFYNVACGGAQNPVTEIEL